MERGGAGGDGDGVGRADGLGEELLERRHARRGGEPAAAQGLENRILLFGTEGGAVERDEARRHGLAALFDGRGQETAQGAHVEEALVGRVDPGLFDASLHLDDAVIDRDGRAEAEALADFLEEDVERAEIIVVAGDVDLDVGEVRGDAVGEVADAAIERVVADVEHLAGDAMGFGGEQETQRGGGVLDVEEGAPLVPAAEDVDGVRPERRGDHLVHGKGEPHARGPAEQRAQPRNDRLEPIVAQTEQGLFRSQAGRAVGADGMGRAVLIERLENALPIHAASGGEDEPAHAVLQGLVREFARALDIHVLGQVLVETARGVVRERGEMHDGVDAVEQTGVVLEAPHVAPHQVACGMVAQRGDGPLAEREPIQDAHGMAGF